MNILLCDQNDNEKSCNSDLDFELFPDKKSPDPNLGLSSREADIGENRKTTDESEWKFIEDEYPIVWYDPDIDLEEKEWMKSLLQENSSINLFSKIERAFQYAKAVGKGFILIVPKEVSEKILLKNFSLLRKMICRRYLDFEKEALLESLFKETSKEGVEYLNVYVCFSRKDFLNEADVDEEEEEVMIMCDTKKMAKQFQEEFTIFWCDPNFNLSEKTKAFMKQLDIVEENIFQDFEALRKRLEKETKLSYHLIVSAKTQADVKIIERIADFKDLLGLYIYESFPLPASIKGSKVEKTFEEVVPKMIEGVRSNSKLKNTFPAFATQFDDWDKSHINKVHYYLKGFVGFKNRKQAKQDFINLAKNIYQSKELFRFEKEYDEYKKEQILKWYTVESPVFKLLNNCLRISTSDSITYCRLILKDMERAIKEEHQLKSKMENGVVYRGAYISETEFEKLEKNIGKEIEMYGFLSTSRDLKTAQRFTSSDTEKKVLITIIIPPLPLPEIDDQGFANISQYSDFPEEEILFNVRSRFQIVKVERANQGSKCRSLTLMYGTHLLRQYMTSQSPITSLKLELPLELKCSDCESKDNLFAYSLQGEAKMICRKCLTTKNFIQKNIFLLPIESGQEKKINKQVKGAFLDFNSSEAKLILNNACECQECLVAGKKEYYKWINLEDENVIIECFDCFEKNKGNRFGYCLLLEGEQSLFWRKSQEKWEKASLDFKTKEFQEFEGHRGGTFNKTQEYSKCQELCRKSLQKLVKKMREISKAAHYINLGISSGALGEHQKALEVMMNVLFMRKFIFGELHPETAISYQGLALVYDELGDHQRALEFNRKALKIRKSVLGEADPQTVNSYHNLAVVYDSLDNYQKSLQYNLKALKMTEFIFGEMHPETSASYNNLALVYQSLGDFQKSLVYALKALEITKFIYGESHSETANSYGNLASICETLGDYQKALEYNAKALDIRKSVLGETHAETAISYNNLASIYETLGDYQKALEYNLKAIDTRASVFGENHPNLGISYNNIALVYSSFGDYENSLKYNLKALEIRKSAYGESNPEVAASYTNLALAYSNLGWHQEALGSLFKAFDIKKSVYDEKHSEIANCYHDIASAYDTLKDYQKALEYNLKALDIKKSLFQESHPDLALSYHNLTLTYKGLGDAKKALEYSLKALSIVKLVYGESHLHTAASYDTRASILESLGNYQTALEEGLKALEITKLIFGELHPETATSYHKLVSVYMNLGENEKALEFQQKALNIRNSILQETHPNIPISYTNLASVHDSLGDYEKAIQFSQKALEIRRSFYGESHPQTAASYDNLASIYDNSQKYRKALKYGLKAFDIRKALYGESHPDILASCNSLVSIYYNLRDYKKAAKYSLKALDITKSCYGESDPRTATSYGELASVYYEQKNYSTALKYGMEALNLRKSIYGELHPQVAVSYNNLALIYKYLKSYEKALEYNMKALNIRKSVYGEMHPDMATSYNNLGLVYTGLKDYQKALDYHLKDLEITKTISGEFHEETANSCSHVGLAYKNLKNYQKADEYEKKFWDIINVISRKHSFVEVVVSKESKENPPIENLSRKEGQE